MLPRITKEQLEILEQCLKENKSVTIMICKTGMPKVSIENALKRHYGLKAKEIRNLGTPYFNKTF